MTLNILIITKLCSNYPFSSSIFYEVVKHRWTCGHANKSQTISHYSHLEKILFIDGGKDV